MERKALEWGLVWILDTAGTPWGVGVLIGPQRILTCAHVVTAAIDGTARPGAPIDQVEVRFTHLGETTPIPARVDAQNWFEPGPHGPGDPGAGDLAVLILEEDPPDGATPVDRWIVGPDHGVDISAFGLPQNHDAQGGGWAGGELAGTQPSGWVQIDGNAGGYRIQPGFSGAPAWSDEVHGVVGLIVAAELDEKARVGWMIPTTQVASRVVEIGAPATASDISDASRYTAPVEPDEREAGYFRVSQIVDAPTSGPAADSSEEGLHEWMSAILQLWFEAKIIVNAGTDHGIDRGDYFDLVAKHEPVVVDGQRAGFLDQPGSLITVVETKPTYSICRLSSFAYATFFNVVLPRRMEQAGGDDAEIDTAGLAAMFSFVVAGDIALRIEPKERDARDEVQDLYDKSLDDGLDSDAKDGLYREMIRRADRFLLRFPSGYFAEAMLYQKGYAQFALREHQDSIDTFSHYLDMYPFGPSIEGANTFVAQATEALRSQIADTQIREEELLAGARVPENDATNSSAASLGRDDGWGVTHRSESAERPWDEDVWLQRPGNDWDVVLSPDGETWARKARTGVEVVSVDGARAWTVTTMDADAIPLAISPIDRGDEVFVLTKGKRTMDWLVLLDSDVSVPRHEIPGRAHHAAWVSDRFAWTDDGAVSGPSDLPAIDGTHIASAALGEVSMIAWVDLQHILWVQRRCDGDAEVRSVPLPDLVADVDELAVSPTLATPDRVWIRVGDIWRGCSWNSIGPSNA